MDVRLQAALISTTIGALVTIIGLILTNRSSSKKGYLDSVNSQRIEWINDLRSAFVKFNELISQRKSLTFSLMTTNLVSADRIKEINNSLQDNMVQIVTMRDNIDLLLNPTEFFTIRLREELNELITNFSSTRRPEDYIVGNKTPHDRTLKKIHFIEQVILKSEWKRIKVETEKGKEINKIEMAGIFDKTAQKINFEFYTAMQHGSDWEEFKRLYNKIMI